MYALVGFFYIESLWTKYEVMMESKNLAQQNEV